MSKLETTKRYHLIINKLRSSKRATFEEIKDALKNESELDERDYNISKRTFQRDVREIESLYGVYIKYDFSKKYYFIEEDFTDESEKRMMEAFDLFNALKTKDNIAKYIHFDNRPSGGTEHLYGLLHAIRNSLHISFTYSKFYENYPEKRSVEPLALKEFKYRWYLFARDNFDKNIKTYALDRLSDLQISNLHFKEVADFDINEYLKDCFGVVVYEDKETQKVVLSFQEFQGKYIKSLPLHFSQKILIDNEKELRISLQLHITHDFIMEVLSFGDTVKVISPKSLAEKLREKYKKALNQY